MATTPAKRACPECGTLLPEEAEFCPVCALREAIETPSESVLDTSSELRFEHYTVLKSEDGTLMELGRGGIGSHLQSHRYPPPVPSCSQDHSCTIHRKRICPEPFPAGSPSRSQRLSFQCGHGASPRRKRRELLLRDGVCGWRNVRISPPSSRPVGDRTGSRKS